MADFDIFSFCLRSIIYVSPIRANRSKCDVEDSDDDGGVRLGDVERDHNAQVDPGERVHTTSVRYCLRCGKLTRHPTSNHHWYYSTSSTKCLCLAVSRYQDGERKVDGTRSPLNFCI